MPQYTIAGRLYRLRESLTLRGIKTIESLELTTNTISEQYEKFLNIVLEPVDGSAAGDVMDITENDMEQVLIDFIEQKKNRSARLRNALQ